MVVLIAKLYYNCITILHKLKYKKISITENVQVGKLLISYIYISALLQLFGL